jgi:hypothetical protein
MIKQAILTKYLSPTNSRGARIKASCERGSITIPYPYEINWNSDTHIYAAKQLIQKFCMEDLEERSIPVDNNPWGFGFVTGQIADGSFVHVLESGFAHIPRNY